MKTVLLTRSEIEPLLHLSTLLPQMRQAFQIYSLQRFDWSRSARKVAVTLSCARPPAFAGSGL